MSPTFSTFLQTLGIVSSFNFSHSSGYVVISHFGFNSHMAYDLVNKNTFSYEHSNILFSEVSVHVRFKFVPDRLLLQDQKDS